jgi:hypothetical protein
MMIVDLTDAVSEQRTFAPLGEGERMWLRLLASLEARHIREQEEAAIEAEDYWWQAEEACDVEPIGCLARSRRRDATGVTKTFSLTIHRTSRTQILRSPSAGAGMLDGAEFLRA